MEKTKIALITYSLSEGGLERIVANSTFLFDEMGYEIHLFVLESKIDYLFKGKLYEFNLNEVSNISKPRIYLKIKKLLKENKYHLIIDHRYRLNPLTEFLWQKWIYNKQNVINYIHSSKIFNYIFKSNLLNKLLFKERCFITVSDGIKKIVNKKFPYLIAKTVYNYVTINKDVTTIKLPEKFVLTIARMEKNNIKQIDVLLECYAKSVLPKMNISLIILGNGENEKAMHEVAEKLKLENLVEFKGFVVEPYQYLKNALFTTLTSKYEGLPTVLIESLLANTPVISYNCDTGPNEIITDKFNGLLIENQNKNKMIEGLNELVENRDLYNNLKKNSLSSAKKFQKETIQKQWTKLINDIL